MYLFIELKNTRRSQRVRYFRVTAKINSKGERLFSRLREVVAQVARARDACGTKVSRGQNGAKTGRPHRCCAAAFNDRRKPHRARVMRTIVTYFNLKYIDVYSLPTLLVAHKLISANKCFTIPNVKSNFDQKSHIYFVKFLLK